MQNFEKPGSPLTLVPKPEKMELELVRAEMDALAKVLGDAQVRLREVQGKLSGSVSEALDAGMKEMATKLSELLDKEEQLQELVTKTDSKKIDDVGPWTAINAR